MRTLLLPAAFLCAVAMTAVSCASTAKVQEMRKPEEVLFDDWEYKGFGRKLPEWIPAYYTGGQEAVVAACPEYAGKQMLVESASGADADQADQALVEKITNQGIDGYVLAESAWVHVRKSKEYVSFCLYVK